MKIALFCHSVRSDWNHGNAHFLRGVVDALVRRGHFVRCYEPKNGWSLSNLVAEHGWSPVHAAMKRHPLLDVRPYDEDDLDREADLSQMDLVLVHEWNDSSLVHRLVEARRKHGFLLLFHDTHHRAVTRPDQMEHYPLKEVDAVLVFGEILRKIYEERGWAKRVFTWHEAADVRTFTAFQSREVEGDVVWIGNWGDGERAAELREFLIEPVKKLGLRAKVYGVRYPEAAKRALADAGIEYGGWLPNHEAPGVFARHRVTVHVPRRPYAEALPGIPTIRVFEALACGIPLVSAPWRDVEGLFRPREDFLIADDGSAMCRQLRRVLEEPELANRLRESGLDQIRRRHTCAHRADELTAIVDRLRRESNG